MRRALVLVLVGLLLPGTASARTSKACKAAAAHARTQLEDYSSLLPYSKIGEARCFDFTGDGRRDLVVTRWEAMNHGAHYWAAFKHIGSLYFQIIGFHNCCIGKPFATGISIRRGGSDILVSQPVYKKGEALCCPTGGTKTGRWRYDRHARELKLVRVTRG